MRRFRKSKSVSWPSDDKLCQVKPFLSEESPSSIGLGAQNHLKGSLIHHAGSGAEYVDTLPPGFDGVSPIDAVHNKLSKIPIITWKCPPKFSLDLSWQVVAGDESNEVECQNQRVMRVLEAVYPCPSAIPPNPSLPTDSNDINQHAPLVPITPIEEDDVSTSLDKMVSNVVQTSSRSQSSDPGVLDVSSSSLCNQNPAANSISPSVSVLGVEPEIIKAACTALSSVMANNNIDPDLLIKILRDPNMMEKLSSSHAESTKSPNISNSGSEGINSPDPSKVHINKTETVTSSLAATPSQGHIVKRNPIVPKLGSEGIRFSDSSKVYINKTETVTSSLATTPNGGHRVKTNPILRNLASEDIRFPNSSKVQINRTIASSLAATPYRLLQSPGHAISTIPHKPKLGSEGIRLPYHSKVHINRTVVSPIPCQPLYSPSYVVSTNPHNMPKLCSEGIILPDALKLQINKPVVTSSFVATPCQSLHTPVAWSRSVPNLCSPPLKPELAAQSLRAPVAKDINYYKSLIQCHGNDRQQMRTQFDSFNNVLRPSIQELPSTPRLNPKFTMKPCMYFNSARGCRHGASCAYQHDVSSHMNSLSGLQCAKRMRMDGGKPCI